MQGGPRYVGTGVAAGAAVIGPRAGISYLIGQTIAGIHRKPEPFDRTGTLMFLGIGPVEDFAPCGIVFALLLAFVLPEVSACSVKSMPV